MCEARGLDHLALAPRLESSGFFEKAVELYFVFMLCIASQPWLVRTGLRFSYVGVGAFNLVRRRAYAQCGGHTAIRLDVLDDVKLGKLIKHAGLKQDVLDAGARRARAVAGGISGASCEDWRKTDSPSSITRWASCDCVTLFMFAASLFPYCALVLWPDVRSLGFLLSVVFTSIAPARSVRGNSVLAWRLRPGCRSRRSP